MGKIDIENPKRAQSISNTGTAFEEAIRDLISEMTLPEKIGQLNQINADYPDVLAILTPELKAGAIGSILNQTDPKIVKKMQRIAVEESRLGIPLLVGRDVIHGFNTITPIPLGQAASWNPDLIQACARQSAVEACEHGINWAFSPMIDVSRDPRWGRIAESFGEDPYLNSVMGVAMIKGLQGNDLSSKTSIAACAKHFVGYGASEGGRDYNTTNISDYELHNIYLTPFKAAVRAGVASLMTSFSDLDGIPATANDHILKRILRGDWEFDGVTVSDWDAIGQLIAHGLAEDLEHACEAALLAGVDVDMESRAYQKHLEKLVDNGRIDIAEVDKRVANILRLKFRLGLFDRPYTDIGEISDRCAEKAKITAKEMAQQSLVLLKNDSDVLPLNPQNISRLSIIGPLADDPIEQLGTWVFDGDPSLTITPLNALKALGDSIEIHHDRAMVSTRSKDMDAYSTIAKQAKSSDAIILCLGEESILSGEAHCRANIELPGSQLELVQELHKTGRPIVAVIMAGRPLTLGKILDLVDAVIFAWHPGTMGGEAIIDTIFGKSVPSGKLPITFPKVVGQIPIYYNHKNTGRPADPDRILHIDDIELGASQTSFGMTSFYLDAGHEPLFPFGFGLGYAKVEYSDLSLSAENIGLDEKLRARAKLKNTGRHPAIEIAQLYIRDLVGSLTRPVKELKGFKRVKLEPGEEVTIEFEISADDLAFYRRDKTFGAEPGVFEVWIGGCSSTELSKQFRLTA